MTNMPFTVGNKLLLDVNNKCPDLKKTFFYDGVRFTEEPSNSTELYAYVYAQSGAESFMYVDYAAMEKGFCFQIQPDTNQVANVPVKVPLNGFPKEDLDHVIERDGNTLRSVYGNGKMYKEGKCDVSGITWDSPASAPPGVFPLLTDKNGEFVCASACVPYLKQFVETKYDYYFQFKPSPDLNSNHLNIFRTKILLLSSQFNLMKYEEELESYKDEIESKTGISPYSLYGEFYLLQKLSLLDVIKRVQKKFPSANFYFYRSRSTDYGLHIVKDEKDFKFLDLFPNGRKGNFKVNKAAEFKKVERYSTPIQDAIKYGEEYKSSFERLRDSVLKEKKRIESLTNQMSTLFTKQDSRPASFKRNLRL